MVISRMSSEPNGIVFNFGPCASVSDEERHSVGSEPPAISLNDSVEQCSRLVLTWNASAVYYCILSNNAVWNNETLQDLRPLVLGVRDRVAMVVACMDSVSVGVARLAWKLTTLMFR